ncbi:MAG: hypothetical protein R3D45_11845 [Rhizobiaceae bacterium]
MKKRWSIPTALATLALAAPGVGMAAETLKPEVKIEATEVFDGTRVAFKPGGRYANAHLVITGPANYQAEAFNRSTLPTIALTKFGKLVDGIFSYHMTAVLADAEQEVLNPGLDNGRGDFPKVLPIVAVASGRFCLKDGKIVPVPYGDQGEDNDR